MAREPQAKSKDAEQGLAIVKACFIKCDNKLAQVQNLGYVIGIDVGHCKIDEFSPESNVAYLEMSAENAQILVDAMAQLTNMDDGVVSGDTDPSPSDSGAVGAGCAKDDALEDEPGHTHNCNLDEDGKEGEEGEEAETQDFDVDATNVGRAKRAKPEPGSQASEAHQDETFSQLLDTLEKFPMVLLMSNEKERHSALHPSETERKTYEALMKQEKEAKHCKPDFDLTDWDSDDMEEVHPKTPRNKTPSNEREWITARANGIVLNGGKGTYHGKIGNQGGSALDGHFQNTGRSSGNSHGSGHSGHSGNTAPHGNSEFAAGMVNVQFNGNNIQFGHFGGK